MPIIFCYLDPFSMKQSVIKIENDKSEVMYSADLNHVAEFMANTYATGKYSRIVLKGQLAELMSENIRSYCLNMYNLNKIEIEVLK